MYSLILLICIWTMLPARVLADDEYVTSSVDPIQGTADKLITGEDGTLRYKIDVDFEIENAWVKVGEDLYYFDNTGRALNSVLRTFDNKTFYFDENSICRNGLAELDGDLYYFTPGLGMNTGWVSADGDEDLYYFDEDGKAHKGFLTLENEEKGEPDVFYFNDDGTMHTGWLEWEKGRMYFNSDGVRLLRWNEIDGEWYYFKEYDEGYVLTSDWIEKDGKRVYVLENGMQARNTELTLSGMEYRFDDNGSVHPKWLSGFKSNYAYIVTFFVTALLVYIASRLPNRLAASMTGISAVIILTLLAALRSTSVGTDIKYYILMPFDWAKENELHLIPFFQNFRRMEPLFNILMFIAVKLGSPYFAMGVLSLITNGFIYAGICEKHEADDRWFTWALYCFLFFNDTLCIMRQYVAVSILFYMMAKNKRIKTVEVILLSLLAVSIHYVGVFIPIIYLLYKLIDNSSIRLWVRSLLSVLMISVPLIGPVTLGTMMKYLVENHRETFRKYEYFIYGREGNGLLTINKPQLYFVLITAVIICAGLICSGTINAGRRSLNGTHHLEDGNPHVFQNCIMAAVDLTYCARNNIINGRLQYFFSIFRLDYLSVPLRRMTPAIKKVVQICLLIAVIFYWVYEYVCLNVGRTSPYMFWFEH